MRNELELDARRRPRLDGSGGRDRVLVSGRLGDDSVRTGSEPEGLRPGPSLPEVLPIEVEGGSGRIGDDLQDGDVRRHAAHGFVDAPARAGVGLPLRSADVVAVRVRILVERFVAARDVEKHVPVRRQSVRREEVLERAAVVARLVLLGGEPELEIGLVGDVVGVGGGSEHDDGEDRRERERKAAENAAHG